MSALGTQAGTTADQFRDLQVRETSLVLVARLDYEEGSLDGSLTFSVENVSGRPATEVPLLLNRLMVFRNARDSEGNPLSVRQDVVTFIDHPKFQASYAVVSLARPLPPGSETTLAVDFSGHLVGYTETGMLYVQDRINEEFTILRTDALAFPSVGGPSWRINRSAPRRDFEFRAEISVPERLTVASGGELVERRVNDGVATFVYRSTAPVPFLNLPIAEFGLLSKSGIRVYYFPEHADGAKRVLERARSALELLGQWFGPLGQPPRVAVMEIPKGWGSQASLTGGIIQTADVFENPDSLQPLYHELSHLWNAPDEERPSPRWNEGLATFLQFLLAERLDGSQDIDATVERSALRLLQAIESESAHQGVPFARYGHAQMTDYSYRTGFVMFYFLHELLGEKEFNRALGGYYQQFRDASGSFDDLVEIANKTSSRNLKIFFDDWFYTVRWQAKLKRAESVAALLESYRSE
jgi:hypothetical protein